MITWIIIWLVLIALVLVVLIQRKWTNWDSWFLVVFALMVIGVVVGLGRHLCTEEFAEASLCGHNADTASRSGLARYNALSWQRFRW
jgi:glucan phosphoethanolaminetransferase (alkaline phosphatase superfamily)